MNNLKFGGRAIIKNYGNKEVLSGANLSLEYGNIIGIFGLNGSGKSTLFRILAGLDGRFIGDLFKNDFEDVAYMNVESSFPIEMRIKDAISFYGRFLPRQSADKIYSALYKCGINKNSALFSLSTGQKQFFKFLLALHSGASVCLFDEPLTNLDVNMRETMRLALISESSPDKLFVIATHEIKELDGIFDGFVILKNGLISQFYQSEQVREQTGKSVTEFYKEKVNEK